MTNRKNWEIGSSTSAAGECSPEAFKAFSDAGIRKAEVSYGIQYLKKLDYIAKHKEYKKYADEYGVTLYSFHLPFNGDYTVSDRNPERRRRVIDEMKRYIEVAAEDGAKTIVLHPSSEPIAEENRARELELSLEGTGELIETCKKCGTILCIEDLPRTCLLNCSFEALTYLNTFPELQLCFDTNHLLMQTNEDFLQDFLDNGMKGRIGTLHVSDYDFIDERHVLPGCGVGINDWKMILDKLEQLDYNGIFMYEPSSKMLEPLDSKTVPCAHREDGYHRVLGDITENYKWLMSL